MLMECLVIFGIISAICVIFLRTNRNHAFQTIPLLILPGANILTYFFSNHLSQFVALDHFSVFVILNILAVVISGILAGIFSVRFETKSSQITYLIMCIVFNIVLASILIQNLYQIYYGN